MSREIQLLSIYVKQGSEDSSIIKIKSDMVTEIEFQHNKIATICKNQALI